MRPPYVALWLAGRDGWNALRVFALLGVLAVGCSPATIIPAPPEVEGFPIGVLGWDGDKAHAILEIDDSIISSSGQSLHWLGLPKAPQPLFPAGTTFVELKEGGVPLVRPRPPEDIFRLSQTSAGPAWLKENTGFDSQAWGWAAVGDLDFCALNNSCVVEGACNVVCGTTKPAIHDPPESGCPEEWGDIGTDGEAFCFPQEWLANGNLEIPSINLGCDLGEMDFGGGCEPLSPCTGEDFGQVPEGVTNAIYVDADAAPGGTGSLDSPYNTIGPALVDGATVMLAEGTYSAEANNLRLAHIIGTCAKEVQLNFSLRFVETSVVVRDLRMSGDAPFLASNSVVEMHGVQFLGESVVAVQSSTLTMFRSDLRGRNALNNSLVVNRSSARVEDSVVRKMAINTSSVTFDHVHAVNSGPGNVINVVDSSLDFLEVELFGQAGYAISVTSSMPVPGRNYQIRLRDSRIVSGHGLLLEESLTTVQLDRVGIVHRQVAGLDRSSIAILQYGPAVLASELAITGFESGLLTETPRSPVPPTHGGRLTVDRAWIQWTGETGLRSGRFVAGGELTNVVLEATTAMSPFADRLGAEFSAVALTSGGWRVSGVRLRPQWRNAVEIQDRTIGRIANVEVVGPHGRSLILQIGSVTEISRFAALGGSDGISITPQVGELGALNLDNIELNFRPVDGRAGLSLNFGAASIGIDSFSFDGIHLVDQTGEVTLTDGKIGFTADAIWTDSFRKSLTDVVVYRQDELQ